MAKPWKDIKRKSQPSAAPDDDSYESFLDDFFLDIDLDFGIECECGSDATYGKLNTLHSVWCPKYKK